MPPRKSEDRVGRLEARVLRLEERLANTRSALEQLRQEPHDPRETLLPHSITEDLLALDLVSATPFENVLATTASLDDGEYEETSVVLPTSPVQLHSLSTSVPARVRVYNSVAQQAADATRAVGVPPVGDHGCLVDVVTAYGTLEWDLVPDATLTTIEAAFTFAVTITNLAGLTTDVDAYFTGS